MTHRTPALHLSQRPKDRRPQLGHAPVGLPHTSLHGGDVMSGATGVGHAGRRSRRGLPLLLGVLLALLLSMPTLPRPALASTVTFANGATATLGDDGTMTGRAGVVFTYSEGVGSTFFDVTMPDGQTLGGRCISTGHTIPLDGSYSFTATDNGDGSYSVVVWASESKGSNPLSAPWDIDPPQNVGGITWTPQLAGWIDFKKVSYYTPLTTGNASYSVAGAVYGIYTSSDCTEEVGRLVTDSSGHAVSEGLPTASYYVREITASPGYTVDPDPHYVYVAAGKARTLIVSEKPSYATPSLLLSKVDADTGTAVAQGSASLEGAVYSVKLYAGYPELEDITGNPLRTLRFRTDAGGRILLDRDHLVSGDLYTNGAGTLALPLGTYVFEEVTPSTGYRSTSPARLVARVRQSASEEIVLSFVPTTDREQVIRGGVVVRKRDAESHAIHPLGSGSFEGISFQILNRSENAVVVGGVSYAPGTVCATITTDEDGVARTAADALPYGRYEIRETGHGRGYHGNESWSQTFDVARQGELVSLQAEGTAVEDQVRRGDISFSKHDSTTGEVMANVPFLLVSNSTGEAHVVVTDENGMFSTAASWNRHTTSTNANDAALVLSDDGSYAIDESKLDPEAGVWFGQATLDDNTTTITAANDALGALPYDRQADGGGYTLRELACSANSGHRMIETTVSVTRDGVNLDLGTFDNQPIGLSTTLTTEDGSHSAAASQQLTLTDVVAYEGLAVGTTFRLSGELHAFAADGSDLGVVSRAATEFTPDAPDGEVQVGFVFDASELSGTRLVAYETLSQGGQVWATHADPDDEGQTVWLPALATVASGAETRGKDAVATGGASVVDAVSYSGLEPGEGYELHASLRLLTEDGQDGGEVAEGVAHFDAEASEGMATVEIGSVDLRPYAGRSLVIFERLERDGETWASHEDVASTSQTVMVPAIGTQVASGETDGVVAASSEAQLIDTVSYENLLPETEYQLLATVHAVSEDGEDTHDAGTIATAEPLAFTTPAADDGTTTVSGSVEVPICADLSGHAGERVVVFEELKRGGVTVATHEDASDEGQTIHVPGIRTTATHAGGHDALATTGQTIVDEVRYENLTPGITYTLTGSLMGIVAEGGEVIPLATASCELVPSASDGSVELAFEGVDLSRLAGGRVVAYEVLAHGELVVAAHQDAHDESQTIHVPAVSTEARSAAGTHTALAGSDQTIVDTISYEGLLPEHRYTATATLHAVGRGLLGGPTDAGAISDPSTVTFTTPAAAEGEGVVSGTVEVPLHAYLTDRAGSSVVCFEQVSRDDVVVATHEDIADEGQTVHLPRLATSAKASDPNEQGVSIITDVVTYENLVPGESYLVVGTLHIKGVNGEDLGAVEIEDGRRLTAQESFVAGDANGSVEVSFAVNPTSLGLAGKSVVVFEELRQDETIVALHNEIGSTDQLVVFDGDGLPETGGPIPQTGWSGLPYAALGLLALASLGSGIAASRKYDW